MTPENAKNALIFLDRVQVTGLREAEALVRVAVELNEVANAPEETGEHQDGQANG